MVMLAGYAYAFIFQMESILFLDNIYGYESAAVIWASGYLSLVFMRLSSAVLHIRPHSECLCTRALATCSCVLVLVQSLVRSSLGSPSAHSVETVYFLQA